MKPNPTHIDKAKGITKRPNLSIYKTHISAASFSKLNTEKSKDPIMITKVNPQAAMRKYDIA
jgi:hypothetical protein